MNVEEDSRSATKLAVAGKPLQSGTNWHDQQERNVGALPGRFRVDAGTARQRVPDTEQRYTDWNVNWEYWELVNRAASWQLPAALKFRHRNKVTNKIPLLINVCQTLLLLLPLPAAERKDCLISLCLVPSAKGGSFEEPRPEPFQTNWTSYLK